MKKKVKDGGLDRSATSADRLQMCAIYQSKSFTATLLIEPVANFEIAQQKLHTSRNICMCETGGLERQILKAL